MSDPSEQVAGGFGEGEDSWVWVRGFRAGAYRKLVKLGLATEAGRRREDGGTMFGYTLTLKGAELFAAGRGVLCHDGKWRHGPLYRVWVRRFPGQIAPVTNPTDGSASDVHHGVAPQHLQAYLNEFTFRFNRRFYPFNAFRSLLGIASDAEPPTYESLYSGEYHHPWALTG